MKEILLHSKIIPKKVIFGDKIPSLLKAETPLRSNNSIVIDLIPLNPRGFCVCTRSERID